MGSVKDISELFVKLVMFISKRRLDIFKKNSLPIIEKVMKILRLKIWRDFVKMAENQNVNTVFLDAYDEIKIYKNEIVWTRKNIKFKKDIIFIIDTFRVFIDVIMKHTVVANGCLVPHRFYHGNGFHNENYEKDLEKYNNWTHDCTMALNNYSYALNRLITHLKKFSDVLTDEELTEYYAMDEEKKGVLYKEMLPKWYWKRNNQYKK